MTTGLATTRGVLIDLDGTVYSDHRAIDGAAAAIAVIRQTGRAVRFVTNTTRVPRSTLVQRLARYGVAAELDEIMTAPRAAVDWLTRHRIRRVALYMAEAARAEFSSFEVDTLMPEAVVVGDLGDEWTVDRLNRAFRQILNGAQFVALQKNRYWRTNDQLALDAGPFVAALEFATGRPATVVGKPSVEFFTEAARSVGFPLAELVVVGDDLASDVRAGMRAGARAVLVRTGKFRPTDLESPGPTPTAVIDSIAELPGLLDAL